MLEVGLTVSISQAKKEDMVAGGNGSEDGDVMVPARHDLQLFSSSARDLRWETEARMGAIIRRVSRLATKDCLVPIWHTYTSLPLYGL